AAGIVGSVAVVRSVVRGSHTLPTSGKIINRNPLLEFNNTCYFTPISPVRNLRHGLLMVFIGSASTVCDPHQDNANRPMFLHHFGNTSAMRSTALVGLAFLGARTSEPAVRCDAGPDRAAAGTDGTMDGGQARSGVGLQRVVGADRGPLGVFPMKIVLQYHEQAKS